MLRHPGQPLFVVGDGALHEFRIGNCGDPRCNCGGTDVEGSAHPVQHVRHMGRAIGPAKAQCRKAEDLRIGTGHHDIVRGRDEFDSCFIVVAPHILGIGRIEDEENMGGKPCMQALHLAEREVAPRWIVRVGKKDDFRLCRQETENCIDVRQIIVFRRHHGRGAVGLDGNRIDEKSILTVDRLVSGPKISMGNELQQLVRPGTADDVLCLEAEAAGDGAAQQRCRTIGIEFKHMGRRLVGLDGLLARTDGRLVGGELVDLWTLGSALSGHVGRDVEDAWLGLRT